MNNVMDETAQEIADLKADLADAQKETARLEKELEEAYAEKPATVAPAPDLTVINELRSRADIATSENQRLEKKLTDEQVRSRAIHTDLVQALSLLEVVRLNKAESWNFFMGTPQGRQQMKWAESIYRREMDVFLNQLPKEK